MFVAPAVGQFEVGDQRDKKSLLITNESSTRGGGHKEIIETYSGGTDNSGEHFGSKMRRKPRWEEEGCGIFSKQTSQIRLGEPHGLPRTRIVLAYISAIVRAGVEGTSSGRYGWGGKKLGEDEEKGD